MADTTEARQLADELAADVASLLREGLPQEALRAEAAQALIRSMLDERDSLRAQVEALRDQRPNSKLTRLDALRFRTLIDTSPGCLCFMGQTYSTAADFRAAIDAARSQESTR